MTDRAPIHYDPVSLLKQLDSGNRLKKYFDLLREENSRINLVSRETLKPQAKNNAFSKSADPLQRLAAESLAPINEHGETTYRNYLDIGSGGGFPAIPILLTYNISAVTLIERTQKKAGALRRITLSLDLRVEIVPTSFEQYESQPDSFDLITMRLVRLTPPLLNRIVDVLHPGGLFVYYATTELQYHNDETKQEQLNMVTDDGKLLQTTLFHKKCR